MRTMKEMLAAAEGLPWEERLIHDHILVRINANIDLADIFTKMKRRPDPILIHRIGPLFKDTIDDSNTMGREYALEALIAFLKVIDADSLRYPDVLCNKMFMALPNDSIRDKCIEVLLLCVELGAFESFRDSADAAVKNGDPEVVVAALNVISIALRDFGDKVVPPKWILKILPGLLEHQCVKVIAATKGLRRDLCLCTGKDNVKSFLVEIFSNNLEKELTADLKNCKRRPHPSRRIRVKLPKSKAVPECGLEDERTRSINKVPAPTVKKSGQGQENLTRGERARQTKYAASVPIILSLDGSGTSVGKKETNDGKKVAETVYAPNLCQRCRAKKVVIDMMFKRQWNDVYHYRCDACNHEWSGEPGDGLC